jgi:hypothetical protein
MLHLIFVVPFILIQTDAIGPVIKSFEISEEGGNPSDGLYQPNLAAETTIMSDENGKIIFRYFVPTSHSCDLKLHIFLDGKETEVTGWLGNYQHTSSLPLKSGVIELVDNVDPNTDYSISFYPESREGGCIVDYIPSWFGKVEFYR